MKYRIFRCFFLVVLVVVTLGAIGSALVRLSINADRSDKKEYELSDLFTYEVLPALFSGTSERRRLLALNRQKDSEFFVGLSGNDITYSDYVAIAKKLWSLPGVYWYTGSLDDKSNLTYFVQEEAYYLGRYEGQKSFAKNLTAYLDAEITKLTAAGVDIKAVLASDPLLLKRRSGGTEVGSINADGLFEVADASRICGSSVCYMLHGSLLSGTDGQEFRQAIDEITTEFKAHGGLVTISGGQGVGGNIARGIVFDAGLMLASGLLISLIVLLVMFKSPLPFLQMLVPFILAAFTGVCAVIGYYGKFHVLTLVLAAPVWAVQLVFFMNFVTSRLAVNDRRPHFTPVGWSLVIVAAAYGLLALSSRSLFAENALFAVTTLVVFTAFLYGPAVNAKCLPLRTHRIFRYMASFMGNRVVRVGAAVLFFLLVWCSAESMFSVMKIAAEARSEGVNSHAIGVDPRSFQTSIGSDTNISRYTVSGDTPELVASKVAAVEKFMRKLQKEGELKSVVTFSGVLVSDKTALANYAFYKSLLPIATEFYKSNGIELKDQKLSIKRPEVLPLEFLLSGGVDNNLRQVLDLSVKPMSTMITVSGITPKGEERLLQKFPSCQSADIVAELARVVNNLAAELVTVLVIFIAGSICLIFLLRGLNGIVCLAWPALTGTGCAIMVIRLTDVRFSLYTVMALVLVYAIGLVSTVFLRRVRRLGEDRLMFCASVAFVISLGCYASLLYSEAHGIYDMGVVLLSGLVCATFSALFVDIVLASKLKSSRFARLATFMRGKHHKSQQY